MKGAPEWKIGSLDVWKTLVVAGYVGVAAAATSIAQAIGQIDFSTVEWHGVNGGMIAMGVTNVLLYLVKVLTEDTSEKTE